MRILHSKGRRICRYERGCRVWQVGSGCKTCVCGEWLPGDHVGSWSLDWGIASKADLGDEALLQLPRSDLRVLVKPRLVEVAGGVRDGSLDMRSFQGQWTGCRANVSLERIPDDCGEEERREVAGRRERKRPGGVTAQGRQPHYWTRNSVGDCPQLASWGPRSFSFTGHS